MPRIPMLLSLIAVIMLLIGCSPANTGDTSQQKSTDPGLMSEEITGLLYLRQEEKLARDVYLALADKWGFRFFSNIASAEVIHMNAIRELLVSYKIPDPVADENARGAFANESLQSLYLSLLEKGMKSAIDAIEVGIQIEELDIADLNTYMASTLRPDLLAVYAHLKGGSENHLRAFVRQYKSSGETYAPKHISQEEADRILSDKSGGEHRNQNSKGGNRNRD